MREEQDGENILAIRLRHDVIDRKVPGDNVILSGLEQSAGV
jgi:hypothetical protein